MVFGRNNLFLSIWLILKKKEKKQGNRLILLPDAGLIALCVTCRSCSHLLNKSYL